MPSAPPLIPRQTQLVWILAACLGWQSPATLSHAAAAPSAASASDPPGEFVAPASDEGEQAIRRFRVPPGLKVELVAAEPMIANPVAFDIDAQGQAYVVETFRHSAVGPAFRFYEGVFDVRSHMNWLEQDLASRTVAARVAMYRDQLSRDDFAKLRRYSDRVRLLRDLNGDGKFDQASVFATGFNDPADGVAAGVLARGREVYFACLPNLWLLRDADGDGTAESRRVLSSGYGVHVAFLGHDLHGLTLGPDGRLYFSLGDRGLNATTPEGRRLFHPDEGVVLRCELDGTRLEVFCRGLRNPQELAFDDLGNLFTADNNSDAGDRARWVHLLPGSDCGWRVGHQHLTAPPRRGPWNGEQLWRPLHKGQPAWIMPPIANLGYGPSGITRHPGTGLNGRYLNRFFMCDFRGGASSGIHSFSLKPSGAGFELGDYEPFVFECLPTDCAFGPDGSFYFSDWVEGWTKPSRGRLYRVRDDSSGAPDGAEKTRSILAQGMKGRNQTELLALLANPDTRVRIEAQYALAEQGRNVLPLLTQRVLERGELRQRLHALWAIGQQARHGLAGASTQAAKEWHELLLELLPLAVDSEPELRGHAMKLAAELGLPEIHELLPGLLEDASLRVRAQVMLGLANFATDGLGRSLPGPALTAAALVRKLGLNELDRPRFSAMESNSSQATTSDYVLSQLRAHAGVDPVIRHAATRLLAAQAGANQRSGRPQAIEGTWLAQAMHDSSSAVRLAAAVALRQLTNGAIAHLLADKNPLVVLEAARAIHETPIDGATPHLAALGDHTALPERLAELDNRLKNRARKAASGVEAALSSVATETGSWSFIEQLYFRVIAANFRLGHSIHASRLMHLASNPALPDNIRAEALAALGDWRRPSNLDRVTGGYRPMPKGRDSTAASAALSASVDSILKNAPEPVIRAAIAAIDSLGLNAAHTQLFQLLADDSVAGSIRAATLQTLRSLKSSHLKQAMSLALGSTHPLLKQEANRLQVEIDPQQALTQINSTLITGSVTERKAAFTALGNLKIPAAENALALWMDSLSAGKLDSQLHLDLLEAAGKSQSPVVLSKVRDFEARRPQTELGAWIECLSGGDVEAGRRQFFERTELGCVKCHRVGGEGGDAGPNLSGIGSRATREHFIESILFANARLTPGFENVLVVLKNETSFAGLLKAESDSELLINSPEDGEVKIKKAEIQTRSRGLSAMPEEFRQILGKRELRDLVEFLASQKQ